MKSVLDLSRDLLFRNENAFKYILTYKFSQDHFELFFNKIRIRLGCNDNPNVLQFKYAVRSILASSTIVPSSNGNCLFFDVCNEIEFPLVRGSSLAIPKPQSPFIAYDMETNTFEISPFLDESLQYIAGYISKKSFSVIDCGSCKAILFHSLNDSSSKKLISIKEKGCLN